MNIKKNKMKINWKQIRGKYYDYIEETFNEKDYDDNFNKMKELVNNEDLPWKIIRGKYYDYIEETFNEKDYDDNFNKFKEIVTQLKLH